MASNVRFLDQVPISSFGDTQTAIQTTANAIRFVASNETVAINSSEQLFVNDFWNQGTVTIAQGDAIFFGLKVVFTHALLTVDTTLNNNGVINVNGILEVGESNTFADVSVI
jgi:hypothetical protein